jgi:putative ABC transport system permease protein
MLKIYLTLTLRDLSLNKGYFLTNLLGLIIGVTAFTLIVLWIRTETSYDQFHQHADDIYRVDYLLYEEEVLEQHSASGSKPIGKEMVKEFPEVLDYTRFYRTESLVQYGEGPDEIIKERKLLYAQSSFFKLFSFPLSKGKADSSILALDHAVLTEECARKYFGEEDPMGKVLKIDGAADYVITGVVKSHPKNSHFSFDILLSYENLVQRNRRLWDDSWWGEDVYTYVLLAPGADVDALQAKIPQIPEAFLGDFMKRAFFLMEFKLVKLTDIHLHSAISNELEVNGNYRNVHSLGIIALLVLLIAFINYLNLATSRAVERAHEVGIRKVSGAFKKDLVLQFLTESALLNLVALIVSFTAVFLLLPFFKRVMQSPLQLDPVSMLLLFVILLVTGTLFTGFLSAIYSARFSPTLVLKGKVPGGGGWIARMKNALVVFQFTVSVILIIGTITIYRQVHFMRHHDLGFTPEGLIVLEGPRVFRADSYESYMNGLEAFKEEIGTLSMVSQVTSSTSIPGKEITNTRVFGIPVEGRNTEKVIDMYYVDDHFFDTYGMTLIAGENFSATMREDSSNIIINEAALPYFGFEDAESTIGDILRGGRQMVYVKAVVRDFNQQIMKQLPGPVAFFNYPSNLYYTIRAEMTDISGLVAELEELWISHYPGNPFHYFFLDDFYNEQYQAEERFSALFLASSLLAIILACLGLSGLSAYAIVRRTKEIGIRKANGAGTNRIMVLLNKHFMIWVALAFILACPVAWFAMTGWLRNYATKTALSWWIFALSGIIALIIALLTVSWQSWRAANLNPTDALRDE